MKIEAAELSVHFSWFQRTRGSMAHVRYHNNRIVYANWSGSGKQISWRRNITSHEVRTATLPKHRRRLVSCSSSPAPSSTSADRQERLAPTKSLEQSEKTSNKRHQFSYLVADERWKVRRMIESEEEMRRVAYVQAEAFHASVFLFNDLFFEFFKAEVLSGLLYRLRNSPPDRYACLVAEPKSNPNQEKEDIAGVVDVTVQREDSVLEHLHGVDEYLYVSGIAVLQKFRRQKAATTLLQACDALSTAWGYEHLVLRAYEDDYGARKLYSSAGYDIISVDTPWMMTPLPWIGGRRRVLMVKKLKKLL